VKLSKAPGILFIRPARRCCAQLFVAKGFQEMKDPGVNLNEGPPDETPLSLLEKVRRQEHEGWQRFVSLYTPLVWHWCKLCKLQQADREEVTQEVFWAVARGIGKFHRDQEGDTFRGWLRKITKNKINDHAPPPGGIGAGGNEAQRRLLDIESPDPLAEASADARAVEDNILNTRAVELIESSFEPNTRRAFWLLIAGRSAKEVSAELHMSLTAVYIAKAKILKRLREEFAELLELSHAT
jgi:RNA polymerase sigma-70 factor, ECF subfamily